MIDRSSVHEHLGHYAYKLPLRAGERKPSGFISPFSCTEPEPGEARPLVPWDRVALVKMSTETRWRVVREQ